MTIREPHGSFDCMKTASLVINEIFHSIQGESLFAGCPCVFIRLTGCNLRCSYCDTAYAFSLGFEMSLDSIIRETASFPCRMVELTGGEPLLQKNTPILVSRLLDQGYTVLLETNGTLPISEIDRRCNIIMDVKCPSSGETHRNLYSNFKVLEKKDQIKFVIQNEEDYAFAKELLKTQCCPVQDGHVLFSPVSGALEPRDLARWILDDGLSVRLHLQQHKYIWPDVDRGV